MISISDAARFSEESNATRKFKAWWETVIDYLILGLLIITLFSWSKVVTAEASGLICITTQSNIAYSYNLAKYLNSRCAQKFDDKAFIHFPYLLFMQWLILSVIQKLWLKLPMVQNRFETFIELFTSLKENESTPHNQAWSTLTRNETLERNSILFILYTTKVITTTISSLIILCLLIAWTSTLKFFKTDFECHIPKINPPAVTSLVCNFQPAQYIYVTIITNIMIQTTITFVGLYASYFCVRRKWERHYKIDKSLRRMKAFKDLCFCICFFKTSVQERQQILYALSNHSIQINNKMADVTNTTVNTHDLKTIKNVCDFLGLEMNKRSNEDSLKSFQGRLNEINRMLTKLACERRTTIVLIHCLSQQQIGMVFHPFQCNPSRGKSVIFLCLVRPNHIFTTSTHEQNSNMHIERRRRFLEDHSERCLILRNAITEIDKKQNRDEIITLL